MKDRRPIFNAVAKKVMLDGSPSRLKLCFKHGMDTQKIVQNFLMSIWMYVRLELDHTFRADDKDVVAMVNQIHSIVTYELSLGKIDERERLTSSTPIRLEGEFRPRVIRAAWMEPRRNTAAAMQALSNVQYKLDERMIELVLSIREGFDNPQDAQDFCSIVNLTEWDHIGSSEFSIPFTCCDKRMRIIADTRGAVSPTYGPCERGSTGFAEKRRVTDAHITRHFDWMVSEFKIKGNPELWVDDILGNERKFILEGGKPLAVSAAWESVNMMKTRESSYIVYADADASMLHHALLMMGVPEELFMRWTNTARRAYVHAHIKLGEQLRNADIHTFRNVDMALIIKLAKGVGTVGGYGGGNTAMVSNWSKMSYLGKKAGWHLGDTENPKKPEIPAALAHMLEGIEDPSEQMTLMVKLAKKYPQVVRQWCPELSEFNKRRRMLHEESMEATGLPTPLVSYDGHVCQLPPFREDKSPFTMTTRIHYTNKDAEGNVVNKADTHLTTWKYTEDEKGTGGAANAAHHADACTIAGTAVDEEHGLLAKGITDFVLIHDAVGTRVQDIDRVNPCYSAALQKTHGVEFNEKFEGLT